MTEAAEFDEKNNVKRIFCEPTNMQLLRVMQPCV